MTLAANKPDLRRIGESAFMEVLGTLLSLSAIIENSASHTLRYGAPDQITSTVPLTGQRLSGSVHVQLPQAFVKHAVHLLTGLDTVPGDATALLDDAAGELANMVAGRVAAQLAGDGYPCTLGTPSAAPSARPPIKTQPGVDHRRIDISCKGHRLSLEIQCRYAVP
jgi:CheY-specific phosphatase CheX